MEDTQMHRTSTWRTVVFSDFGLLVLLALAKLILHTLTNGQYGWHRDELDVLDNARYLDWGYVSYPPVTPFIAAVALALFGPSLVGVCFGHRPGPEYHHGSGRSDCS
jgi:hypothetical protein